MQFIVSQYYATKSIIGELSKVGDPQVSTDRHVQSEDEKKHLLHAILLS